MPETTVVLGPPEVLWLDVPEFEHWTGRTPRTILRDFQADGLTVHERGNRKFIFHSEYLAFLKATSRRKDENTDDRLPDAGTHRPIRRDERGRIVGR